MSGHTKFTYAGAHADFVTAIGATIAELGTRSVDGHHLTEVHRFGHFLQERYPQLTPSELTVEHVREHKAWVNERTSEGSRDRDYAGCRLLLVKLVELKLVSGATPDLFAKAEPVAVRFPAELPQVTREQLAALTKRLDHRVAQRIKHDARVGIAAAEPYKVLLALKQWFGFIAEHNAQENVPRWPLEFAFLFTTVEPLALFIAVLKTKHGDACAASALRKRGEIFRAYEFLHQSEDVGAADFRERVVRHMKQFDADPSDQIVDDTADDDQGEIDDDEDKKGVRTALEPHERQAVYGVLAARRARALRSASDARDEREAAAAAAEEEEVECDAGIWETAVWTGLRPSGLATLDTQYYGCNEFGSGYFRNVNYKAHNAPDLGTQWFPARARRSCERYLAHTGRRFERGQVDPEEAWGPAVYLFPGDRYGQKILRKARTFYPLFRGRDGRALTPDQIGARLRRLMVAAGCHSTIPTTTRHTFCSMLLNEYGLSVAEVKKLGHWKSDRVVLKHYAQRTRVAIWQIGDAVAEDFLELEHEGRSTYVAAFVEALMQFLEAYRNGTGEHRVVALRNGLVDGFDALAKLGPTVTPLSECFVWSTATFAAIDREVMRVTGRRSSLRKIATKVLGEVPRAGLGAPSVRGHVTDAPIASQPEVDEGPR